jgi:hypothetical protein
MAHYVSTNTPLTTKAISEESEKAVKFEAKTKLLTGEITAISGNVQLLTPGAVVTAAGIFPAGTTVVSVNVSAKTAVLSNNAEKEGAAEKLEIKTPVFKPYIFTSQPAQTDFAEYISGSSYSEKEGVLEVQQSFDYPQDHENEEKALEKAHWDSVEKITIKNGEGKSFYFFTVAPYFRLVYTQGSEETKKLRISARAQEKGRL